MKLWLAQARRGTKLGLIPTDDQSRAVLGRLGEGECVRCEVVRPRSVQWNRMYWGMCREIGENQDPQRDEDSIDSELRILAGHYELMFIDGHEVRVPRRIAFDKMDADQWADYWQRVELAISERFGSEYLREVA